jgi:DNA-binding response OmpR family regulator
MSIRVLLADTDEAFLASHRTFLSQNGFEVETATNGLDCLTKLRGFVPDVLVLEPDLPWGQGEGVLALMEEGSDVPLMPVMVLSARHDPHAMSHGVGWGISAYQVKPVPPTVLANRIRQLVDSAAPAGGFFG